jgi:hypothetical protein
MEAVRTSETSVSLYETTRRNIPEGCHTGILFDISRLWKTTKICYFCSPTCNRWWWIAPAFGSHLPHTPTESEHLASNPLKVRWVFSLPCCALSCGADPHLQTRVGAGSRNICWRKIPTRCSVYKMAVRVLKKTSDCDVMRFDPWSCW